MGQSMMHRHHPKGSDWRWAQRDFEERPVHFIVKTKAQDPVCKRLSRKIGSLERKYEATNPKAILTLANIERLAKKYDTRLKNRVKLLR